MHRNAVRKIGVGSLPNSLPSPSSDPVAISRIGVASARTCQGKVSWDYDRTEIIADGIVHAVGIVLGLIGAVAIVIVALEAQRVEVAPILIYVVGLLAMLALSAAYNMWPITPTKWI